jgi:hypothetical protein
MCRLSHPRSQEVAGGDASPPDDIRFVPAASGQTGGVRESPAADRLWALRL